MADVKCICGAFLPESECHEITLTDSEVAAVKARFPDKPELRKVHYCRPCWALLQDPERIRQVSRGLVRMQAERMGMADPDGIADRFYQGLLRVSK